MYEYNITHSVMPNFWKRSLVESYWVMRPCLTSSIASLKLAVLVMSSSLVLVFVEELFSTFTDTTPFKSIHAFFI